jgi:hypothetical protein
MTIEEEMKNIIRENAESDEDAENIFRLIDASFESKAELDREIKNLKEELLNR